MTNVAGAMPFVEVWEKDLHPAVSAEATPAAARRLEDFDPAVAMRKAILGRKADWMTDLKAKLLNKIESCLLVRLAAALI